MKKRRNSERRSAFTGKPTPTPNKDEIEKPAKEKKRKSRANVREVVGPDFCIACPTAVEIKKQKNHEDRFFVRCLGCSNKYFLNSERSLLGYQLNSSRTQSSLSSGNSWYVKQYTTEWSFVDMNWMEKGGLLVPRGPMQISKIEICPLCTQDGELKITKEGKASPTFYCPRCIFRIFFRSMAGYTGFRVQQAATHAQRFDYIRQLNDAWNARVFRQPPPAAKPPRRRHRKPKSGR